MIYFQSRNSLRLYGQNYIQTLLFSNFLFSPFFSWNQLCLRHPQGMYAKQICCMAIFCSAWPSDLTSCLKHCGSHIKLLCENWDCNFYRNVHTPSSWHSQPFHQIKNGGYRVCFRALVTNEKYGSLVNLRLSIQSVMVASSSTPIGYTHITGLQQVPLFDYYYSTFSKDTRLDKNGKKRTSKKK